VAFLYSAAATIWPAADRQVYFDAVLLILGFLLLGKSLEGRAKRRALAALDSLSRLKPATARRVRDGIHTVVPLEEIQLGDSVLILPGERFPVDATILEGRTTVDESMLTGEPTPLDREAGGRVLAGSLNYEGAVTCRAESLGEAHRAGADYAHGHAGARLARADGAAGRPRQPNLCAHGAGPGRAYFHRLAYRHALAAAGSGRDCCRAGDRLPLRDGIGRARRADRGCRTRRADGRALQGRRGAGTAGSSGRDGAGQDRGR
jgi:magnesium-transporting ATPase (P-type)